MLTEKMISVHCFTVLMISGKLGRKIGEDLPSEPINVIREDHTNENLLYVGTDNGLYIS